MRQTGAKMNTDSHNSRIVDILTTHLGDGQIDRQTDRQTDRQRGRQVERSELYTTQHSLEYHLQLVSSAGLSDFLPRDFLAGESVSDFTFTYRHTRIYTLVL